jgi:hypothetical protein
MKKYKTYWFDLIPIIGLFTIALRLLMEDD